MKKGHDLKKEDLRSDESIKRAGAFAALWLSPFVRTHTDFIQAERINSGLKSPNELGRPPAASAVAGKLRLSVVQPGLLTREHRNKAWLHVHPEGRFPPLPLQDGAPNVFFSPTC